MALASSSWPPRAAPGGNGAIEMPLGDVSPQRPVNLAWTAQEPALGDARTEESGLFETFLAAMRKACGVELAPPVAGESRSCGPSGCSSLPSVITLPSPRLEPAPPGMRCLVEEAEDQEFKAEDAPEPEIPLHLCVCSVRMDLPIYNRTCEVNMSADNRFGGPCGGLPPGSTALPTQVAAPVAEESAIRLPRAARRASGDSSQGT